MTYTEEKLQAKQYKQDYVNGIRGIIARRFREAEVERDRRREELFSDAEARRNELKSLLGWPLVALLTKH